MTLNTILLLAVLALLLIAVILLIVLLARRNRLPEGAATTQSIAESFSRQQADFHASMSSIAMQSAQAVADMNAQTAQHIAQNMMQLDGRMAELRTSVDAKLTEMYATVNDKLTETLNRRLNDSFHQVSERLEQVYKGLGEMQTLAGSVGDLKKVLTNVSTRGAWGEMQLGALISQLLTREQYAENIVIDPMSNERVEFAIRLPGRDLAQVLLPIDSKFPMEDFRRLLDASQNGDAASAAKSRAALFRRIQDEAKKISTKYIRPPHTTDFAIMFLPSEGLYGEVVRSMEQIDDILREHRVVIAGPSTFAALLNALQMGFRTLAIEQRSGEIMKLLNTVKTDFSQFNALLTTAQKRLNEASETFNKVFTRSETIQLHLDQIHLKSGALPKD